MRVLPSIALLAVAAVLCAQPVTIGNAAIRAELEVLPTVGQYRLHVLAPVAGQWQQVVRVNVLGDAIPAAVQATADELTFDFAGQTVRLRVREDLPFIFVDGPERTSIEFLGPVRFLVADTAAAPWCRVWWARNFREDGLWTTNDRYLAVAGADMPYSPMILWLPDSGSHKTQWAYGGLKMVLPDAPYVLAVDTAACTRDPHTLQHRAVGFVSQLRGSLANPGDSAP